MHGQQSIKVRCINRGRLQSESLNFTQGDGQDKFLLGTVTYNVGSYLNMNTQCTSVRRTVYAFQCHTVLLVCPDLYESKQTFKEIDLLHGP